MRQQIAIAPMQWAPIQELQYVEPLNDDDVLNIAAILLAQFWNITCLI